MSEETTNATEPNPTEPNSAEPTSEPTADLAEFVRRVEAEAASIPASRMKRFRGYADIMAVNVGIAARSFSTPEVKATLKEQFTKVDGTALVQAVIEGAAATDHLSRLARKDRTERMELQDAVEEATSINAILNPTIEAAVVQGIIPAGRAEALPTRKGRSLEALGGRVIDAAMLLKGYEAELDGRILIDDDGLDRAIEVGTTLRTAHAKRRARVKWSRTAIAERRDRAYTWTVARYDELRRVGAFIFGDELDRFVPPLTSHKLSRRKAEDVAQPAAGEPASGAVTEKSSPASAQPTPVPTATPAMA